MNPKGAYGGFRQKVSDAIDKLLGLKGEAYDSVNKMILFASIRSIVIVAVIVLAGFACSHFFDYGYSEDVKYEKRALENIEWANENLKKLDEAYENGDYETVDALLKSNYSAASQWPSYSEYILKREQEEIGSDGSMNVEGGVNG